MDCNDACSRVNNTGRILSSLNTGMTTLSWGIFGFMAAKPQDTPCSQNLFRAFLMNIAPPAAAPFPAGRPPPGTLGANLLRRGSILYSLFDAGAVQCKNLSGHCNHYT